MSPRDEMVAIVDVDNRVIGAAPRHEMRSRNLPHRATYVFVFNPSGDLYVQHRTWTKDVYPGYWDLAAGGVVLDGESYDESASRELEEEMGIRGVTLHPWFEFYFDGAGKCWGRAYSCVWDGPVVPQAEEVQSVTLASVDTILSGWDGRLMTPDSLLALRRRFKAD
ncbi:MAG: NUDIX domain-containing protein [Bryobacterales bacterium]|nr:NUDIX domain-containing protein [Bryobacterales bacterium]